MPWLCFTLGYRLFLEREAENLPGGRCFETFFYPFQTGFYTILEDKVDNEILSALTLAWVGSFPGHKAVSTMAVSPMPLDDPSSVHNPRWGDPGIVANPIQNTWQSILDGANPIEINGVKIYNPVFLTVDKDRNFLDIAPRQVGYDRQGNPIIKGDGHDLISRPTFPLKIPGSYVVKGTIKLFGTIPAEITTANDGNGVYEIVKPIWSLYFDIAWLIPDLAQLTGISLKDMTLTYRSKYRGSISPGLRLDFKLVPMGPLEPVATVLKEVFGQEKPNLILSGLLSLHRNWDVAPKPIAFSLRAALLQMNLKLADVVTITELGVDVHVTQGIGNDDSGRPNYDFGLGFSGAGAVNVPGSCVPMRVHWNLSQLDTVYWLSLQLTDEEWTNVLGVIGLNLSKVQFTAIFATTDLANSISFSIQACLQYRSGMVMVGGSLSKNNCEVEGLIRDFDLALLTEFYEDVFGHELCDIGAEHQIVFDFLHLRVTNGLISFSGAVTLNGYTSVNASITLSTVGIEITGGVDDIDFGFVTIKNLHLDVFIGRIDSKGTPYRASISGTVDIEGIVVTVGLYVDGYGSTPQWIVYGEIEDLKLSDLASVLRGTFLDLQLTKVALIASNREGQQVQLPNKFSYPVVKGLQLWATVKQIDVIRTLTRDQQGPPEIQLCIAFDAVQKSLAVSLLLSTPATGQEDPLELRFVLDAGIYKATGAASMNGFWTNPFGISPKVKVADLALEVEIIYAEFLETGPSRIGLGGKLIVGQTTGALAVNVDQNPTDELISVTIQQLGLSDLILFARQVAQQDIPSLPSDILFFRNVFLYISTGVWFNNKYYPPGLKFDCDMDVFGKQAKADAVINAIDGIKIDGTIDSFDLGPLELTGKDGKNAELDIEIGTSIQRILLDGAFRIGDIASASTHVEVELLPEPRFNFTFAVQFTPLTSFSVLAKMLGSLFRNNTQDLDFVLHAEFAQDILQYLTDQAQDYFKSFDAAQKAGFEAEHKKLDEEEKSAKLGLEKALGVLDDAKAVWEALRRYVYRRFNEARALVDSELKALREVVSKTRAALDEVVRGLEAALEAAKRNATSLIDTAEAALATARRIGKENVKKLEEALSDSERALTVAFGDVDRAIRQAEADVKQAQGRSALKLCTCLVGSGRH
ncbi:hypothetical protein ABW21_db0200091 [Orbilia brochopaga]|nr:hypothetical protein ABW21_db0200091 [Drechslerella brochopaga]